MNLDTLMSMGLDQTIYLNRMIVSQKIIKLEMDGTCSKESIMLRACVNRWLKKYNTELKNLKKRNILYVSISVRELLFIYKEEVLMLLDKIHYDTNNTTEIYDNISNIDDEEIIIILSKITKITNKKRIRIFNKISN
ncbi:MAG: hypothetical protein R3Y13_00385 [bacterium]